jgi:hypothetical protein
MIPKWKKKGCELRHWEQLIHEALLIEHIHLLQILQIMYNKYVCVGGGMGIWN